MRITKLADLEPRSRKVAVGEFDGVHVGHRQVIRGNDTVLTFEPHPLRVVRPEAAPRLLTSFDVKCELIAGLGVGELVVIPFDQRFAHQTPQEFIDDVLVGRLRATHVSVGENFRFGHRAAGDHQVLAADSRFETRVVPLVELEGEIVSSSHIRALVQAGEVAAAARMLGGPFQVVGEVVEGEGRGRTLGFPTANLVPDEALVIPGHGVYVAHANGACAAVSVGVRPTFGTGRGVLIEAYLLDREVDLYGQTLRVEFLERLRGERRFESVAALTDQMHSDVERVRQQCGRAVGGLLASPAA